MSLRIQVAALSVFRSVIGEYMGSRFNEWEYCRAVVWARVAPGVGLRPLGRRDYDYRAVAPSLEFAVVPRHPRRRILDDH